MKILAFACACTPGTGSEAGAGWVWSLMLAELGETWVLTREKHRAEIERGLRDAPQRDNLHFVYLEGPAADRIQRGSKNLRLNYMLWQFAALREARRLDATVGFDVVWHLTWANVWLGATAALLKRPFIYGPVGGGVATPWRLWRALGPRGVLLDALRSVSKGVSRYANPLARVAWSRADLILVQNPDTKEWLPARHRDRVEVFPHVVLTETSSEPARPPREGRPLRVMFAGRLLEWKGVHLALAALRHLPDWELLVCGTGRDETRLRAAATKLGVDARTRFMGWVAHDELARIMREDADVFVLPSLHDEAGWVVVEARDSGLPVVSLDRGGPPVLGAIPVPVSGFSATARRLAETIATASANSDHDYDFESRLQRLRSTLGARRLIKSIST